MSSKANKTKMEIDLRVALRQLAGVIEPKEKAAAALMLQAADALDTIAATNDGLVAALERMLATPPGTDPTEIMAADDQARAAIARAKGQA